MEIKYSKSILASYATFKELYNSQKYKSPYQILSEFICYIITTKSLYSFTSTDIQSHLNDEFGFNLPLAVIRSTLHNTKGVIRDHQTYTIDYNSFENKSDFQLAQQRSEENKESLLVSLIEFAKSKKIILNKDKIEK